VGWIRVLDCSACNVAFSFPRLEPTQAARFFTDRRPEIAPPYIHRVEDMEATPFDRSRELSWVRKYVRAGKLVDVGCSWGYGVVQARALGFEAFGTELSRTLSRTARERFGLDVHEQDFTDLGLEEKSLDVVLAIHVIQHFLDPRAFFADAARVLRAGGVLVGAVPNYDAYLREVLGRRFKWLDPECQPYHFRPAPLLRELESAAFEVEMWTSEGQYGGSEILEHLTPAQAQDAAQEGRGSEIGFIARRRD
jgi:SAM-dependent methyltransferase